MREHQDQRDRQGRTGHRRGRARTWILIAFALLLAGLVGGGASHSDQWKWILPAGGFVAYVFAFRHALRLTRFGGRDIDDLWRSLLIRNQLDREVPRTRGLLWKSAGGGKATVMRWDSGTRLTSEDRQSTDADARRKA